MRRSWNLFNLPAGPVSFTSADTGRVAADDAVSHCQRSVTIDVFPQKLTANIAATITDQFGNPGAGFSGNYQYEASDWCDSGIIQNGGFETGDFTGWVITGHDNDPVVSNVNPRSGTYSAAAGNFGPYPTPEPTGLSEFYQQFTVPAGQSTLSLWHWDYSTDPAGDAQAAFITDGSGNNILQIIFDQLGTNE